MRRTELTPSDGHPDGPHRDRSSARQPGRARQPGPRGARFAAVPERSVTPGGGARAQGGRPLTGVHGEKGPSLHSPLGQKRQQLLSAASTALVRMHLHQMPLRDADVVECCVPHRSGRPAGSRPEAVVQKSRSGRATSPPASDVDRMAEAALKAPLRWPRGARARGARDPVSRRGQAATHMKEGGPWPPGRREHLKETRRSRAPRSRERASPHAPSSAARWPLVTAASAAPRGSEGSPPGREGRPRRAWACRSLAG